MSTCDAPSLGLDRPVMFRPSDSRGVIRAMSWFQSVINGCSRTGAGQVDVRRQDPSSLVTCACSEL